MKKRLSKETTERIEGCGITTDTQLNLKESITDATKSMISDGWEYEDVKDYLFDLIDDIVETQERHDEKEVVARMHLFGRQVVIIDETHKQNNVSIKTISDFELKGIIWFEEDKYGTHFWMSDVEAFLQGRKVYIHDGEVSMQLVNSASKTL